MTGKVQLRVAAAAMCTATACVLKTAVTKPDDCAVLRKDKNMYTHVV